MGGKSQRRLLGPKGDGVLRDCRKFDSEKFMILALYKI
jgi:hypothetical protein